MKTSKFWVILITLFVGLFAGSGSVLASIGAGAGSGVDANGVIYTKGWVSGLDFSAVDTTYSAGKSWYESYNDGTNTWGNWFEIASYTDPTFYTGTGSYYVWTSLTDGAGTTATSNVYDIADLYYSKREMTNSITGYYTLDYLYNDNSGTVGAYYEQTDYTLDPTSGMIDWSYTKNIDSDGDGSKDDWRYNGWNWYDPGTGDGGQGYDFYNYVEGFHQYDDFDYNSVTGDYYINKQVALDTDLNGDFYDNYYTEYNDSYNAYDGSYWNEYQEVDYAKLNHGAAAYYQQYSQGNRLTGWYDNWTQAQIDTNNDGSFWDIGWTPGAGAYYKYTEEAYYLNDGPYYYTYNNIYDPINNQYTDQYSYNYPETGYQDGGTTFYWDANKDGSIDSSGDYWYNTNYTRNDEGWNYDYTNLYDYVSTYANSYYYESDWNIYTGDGYAEKDVYVDNDMDKDLYDYQEKGVKYTYDYASYDSYDGYSYSESEVWDPAGDYDGTTFGTYQYYDTYAYLGGDSGWYVEYAKDTDNDGYIENWEGDDYYSYSTLDNYAQDGYTYAESWLGEDQSNTRGKYNYAYTDSETYLTGSYDNYAELANLGGYVYTSEGRNADDNYTWKDSEIRTWGVDRKYTETWAYDAGDSGSYSSIYLDTDADTAWDNTWNYEAYAESWDKKEGSFRYVGYETGDADWGDGTDFAYNYYNQTYSPSFDQQKWQYAAVDRLRDFDNPHGYAYSTDAWDQTFMYASGGTTPAWGTYTKYNSTLTPYSYERYLYTADSGAWYLQYYLPSSI